MQMYIQSVAWNSDLKDQNQKLNAITIQRFVYQIKSKVKILNLKSRIVFNKNLEFLSQSGAQTVKN